MSQTGRLLALPADSVPVIGALLMREIITRYGRDNLGFLGYSWNR